eukprot:CAMPEP_0119561248 /NCGR_PEP_ID=MMETSP1352-20130426/17102_1 /TAXON_ID=265584 /ORGANISM="Stauroneis constricta, Strain CCMP1120" /LENGTH=636 /DNA_ID=CAMNT_0007609413 /DNA_START=37 /DNA_END=1947 /DNA_ORIENTATION=+
MMRTTVGQTAPKPLMDPKCLMINGTFTDSISMAEHLENGMKQLEKTKIAFRNVSIDETIVTALHRLLIQSTRLRKQWDKFELTHCTGMLPKVFEVLHKAGNIMELVFTGSLPIAHNPRYSLTTQCLRELSLALKPSAAAAPAAAAAATLTETADTTASNDDDEKANDPDARTPLETLCLRGTRIPREGLSYLCLDGLGNPRCPLVTLRLSQLHFQSPDVALLANALSTNQKLEMLLLAHCKLSSPHRLNPLPQESEHRNSSSNENDNDNENDHEDDDDDLDEIGSVESHPLTEAHHQDDEATAMSLILEAIQHHPSLECLLIYGMRMMPSSSSSTRRNNRAAEALGRFLEAPTCKLWQLGLKYNVDYHHTTSVVVGRMGDVIYHPNRNNDNNNNENHDNSGGEEEQQQESLNILPIIEALRTNRTLQYFQCSGNNISSNELGRLSEVLAVPEDSDDNANSSTTNPVLEGLGLTDNAIDDEGLKAMAKYFGRIHCLKYLDLHRNPFTDEGKEALVKALSENRELERLDLDGIPHPQKTYYINLNRGGRRLLQSKKKTSIPLGLWPVVLGRANRLHFGRSAPNAHLDVLYCLLRGPALFERDGDDDDTRKAKKRRGDADGAAAASATATEPQTKRQRI